MGVPETLTPPAGWGPGVPLAAIAEALVGCDAESALSVVEAMERVKRWADGVAVAATRVLTMRVTAEHVDEYARDHNGELSERTELDLARQAQMAVADELAIGAGAGQARDLVGVACAAPERTAVGLTALFAGETSLHRVQTLWRECAELPPRTANEIADKVLGPTRDGVPLTQRLFRQRLRQQLATHNTPKKRREKALAGRDATSWQHADGTGEFNVTGATERIIAAHNRVAEIAKRIRDTGDPRTLAQLRSDIALDLLLYGTTQTPPTQTSPTEIAPQSAAVREKLLAMLGDTARVPTGSPSECTGQRPGGRRSTGPSRPPASP